MTREGELQAAINAKCTECSGGMRGEIRDCRLKNCPLWAHRPYQRAKAASCSGTARQGRQLNVFEVLEAMA